MASPVVHNVFMLSIGPIVNAQILLGVMLETKVLDAWQQGMGHGAQASNLLRSPLDHA